MAFKDNTITIEFSVTREYSYTESADVVAKTLGISLATLRRLIEDGDDLTVKSVDNLVSASDMESEELNIGNVDVEELD